MNRTLLLRCLERTGILHACFALAVAASSTWSAAARANDGGISWGGSPSLLKSHPSISMESEEVNIIVGDYDAVVDCRFVFRNSGPATSVRMGFPDDGEGESGFYDGAEAWKNAKPQSSFKWFRSWVDGKPSKTTLVRSSEPGQVWHAKTVAFPARGRRVVRDLYSVPLGSQIARNGSYKQTAYTLHTGSSWKGKIGRSLVTVRFDDRPRSTRLRAIPMSQVPKVGADKDPAFERVMKPNVVVIGRGPGGVRAARQTLRWDKRNWRPTKKDDIWLVYNFRSFDALRAESKANAIPRDEAKLPYVDVFPFARRLGWKDVDGLNAEQTRLMRNAIYARRGRPFEDAKLRKYFGARAWYRPRATWTKQSEARLSRLERENAAFLLSLEPR
jgi:hypothetical protein